MRSDFWSALEGSVRHSERIEAVAVGGEVCVPGAEGSAGGAGDGDRAERQKGWMKVGVDRGREEPSPGGGCDRENLTGGRRGRVEKRLH